MKLVIQRVKEASVEIGGEIVGQIGNGCAVLIGVGQGDTKDEADYLADRLLGMRIFEDENGKMNRSIQDIGGEILVVSQFTLYADAIGGRRPSFTSAAAPNIAETLYDYFVGLLKQNSKLTVKTGKFGADMLVRIANDGPVTILIDTADRKKNIK